MSRLSGGHKLPLVVLMEGDSEVARVANDGGTLHVGAVESMLRVALDERESAVEASLAAVQ